MLVANTTFLEAIAPSLLQRWGSAQGCPPNRRDASNPAFRQCLPALAAAVGLLAATNAIAAGVCLSDQLAKEQASGRLSIGRAKDAVGRLERPYILNLTAPVCLSTVEPEDKVHASKTIHVYAGTEQISAELAKSVGKSITVRGRPFPAHTAHHHAPIVMEVIELDSE